MNKLEFLKYLRPINYFNLVNYYKILFEKFVQIPIIYKRRRYLRNSKSSEFLYNKYIGNNISIDELSKIFFQKNIFYYSNIESSSDIINILDKKCTIEKNKFIDYANCIIENDFQIFEKHLKFEKSINWHYGFAENYNWSMIQSNQLDIIPQINNHNVDVKYVWELNRHLFLTYLGFAYYYTQDEKYALKFKEIILHWIRHNPPMIGINWFSGLEISIRLTSWIFTLYFFKSSEIINNSQFFKIIFRSMFQHAYYLRFFYTKRSFNHTIGELFGRYLFSHIFNDYKKIKNWEQISFKKLKTQILLQVRPDGFHIEQSINYHRFVLEFFMIFLLLNKDLIESPEGILIKKMVKNLSVIVKPNGNLPLFGDVDNGKVLLLSGYNDKSHLDLINLGCVLFKSSDLKHIVKKLSPISLLLIGPEEVKSVDSLEFYEPKNKVIYYENSGYILLRNGWDDKSSYLFVDLGNFGPQRAPHSHSGISNIILSCNGKDILIDSGTKSYNRSMEGRNYFRGSIAHNVISIDNKNQAKPSSWFGWTQKPKTSRNVVESNDLIQILCNHNGYSGFLVQRLILASKDLRSIIIKDKVQPESRKKDNKKHQIELNYHFPEGTSLDVDFEGKNSVLINKEIMLSISSNSIFNYKVESAEIAPKYGETHQISVLKIQVFESFSSKNSVSITTEFRVINQ
jgi:hypothetical protein